MRKTMTLLLAAFCSMAFGAFTALAQKPEKKAHTETAALKKTCSFLKK